MAYTYQQQQLQLNEQLFTKRKAAAIAKGSAIFSMATERKREFAVTTKSTRN
jgi:hypothetical protein